MGAGRKFGGQHDYQFVKGPPLKCDECGNQIPPTASKRKRFNVCPKCLKGKK